MRDLNTVFCHQHSHSQPRYPHFVLCPYCREDAPYEALVVEAVVNYFSLKFHDFFRTSSFGLESLRCEVIFSNIAFRA